MTQRPLTQIPSIDPAYWTFSIGIAGQAPFILTYDELLAMPLESWSAPIVPNTPKTFEALDTHRWRGIAIEPFLDTLTPSPDSWAWMCASDGYTAALPYQALRRAFLAPEKNGQPLSPEAGFPARLIVPGAAGFKMPKWIARIEIGEQPRAGFWENRGRSLTGEFNPRCVLHVSQSSITPGDVLDVRVRAYGSSPILSLSVSIDHQPPMPVPFTLNEAGIAEGYVRWIANQFDCVQVRAIAFDELGASSQGRTNIFAPITSDTKIIRGLV